LEALMPKKRESAHDKRIRLAADVAHQERVRLGEAAKVFLEYHEHSTWAAYKLHSGTAPLTPESVAYMQQEIDLRKRRAAYAAEIKAELDAEKPPANPIGGTK
jgi:hypothetical protein